MFLIADLVTLSLMQLIQVGKLYILRVCRLLFPIFFFIYFLSLKNFVLANSAGPDEKHHNATFRLGLHCLPKYLLMRLQSSKGPTPHLLQKT